ncbi:MAG: hypothetical protein ACOCVG_02415 [Verrucomicrobiota bacterium]
MEIFENFPPLTHFLGPLMAKGALMVALAATIALFLQQKRMEKVSIEDEELARQRSGNEVIDGPH